MNCLSLWRKRMNFIFQNKRSYLTLGEVISDYVLWAGVTLALILFLLAVGVLIWGLMKDIGAPLFG